MVKTELQYAAVSGWDLLRINGRIGNMCLLCNAEFLQILFAILRSVFNLCNCLVNDVWLTVHRSSMWNKKPTICHLVLYLFLLYKLLNMFRATLCPSSGADDLVVFLPRVV